MRRSLFADARGESPYLATAIGDEVFFVSTDDHGLGKSLFVHRRRNDIKGLSRAVAQLSEYGIPQRPLFVEVGANLGVTTVMAIRRHGFAAAVALEPAPASFRLLRLNLVANDVDGRVETLPVAASASGGTLRLAISRDSGRHHVTREGKRESSSAYIPAVSLDTLVENGTIEPAQAGLLWIDTAGHEADVLAGASALLEAGVPLVTAIRPNGKAKWQATKHSLLDLLPRHYTDVFELRDIRRPQPIGELGQLLDSVNRSTDILLARRL